MRVLFSPVGSTDPISNQRDGALLHITRAYKPDVIYLYCSKEILDWEKEDNRYIYCLNKLKEKDNLDFTIKRIERPELVEVQVFDIFLEEYSRLIAEIFQENSDTELLLNVSSGTPAMKSALQVIAAMSDKNMLPVQVASPNRSYNAIREKVKGEYDVEMQWEMNLDNEADYENRCTISSNVNMIGKIKKEIIKRHIAVYDYTAAITVAETMGDWLKDEVKILLQAGEARMQMDRARCDKLLKDDAYDMFPCKNGGDSKIFEYLMLLNIRLKQKEYAEFIRGMSPLFYAVLIRLFEGQNKIRLDEIVEQNRWKQNAPAHPIVQKAGIKCERGRFVSSSNLTQLLDIVLDDNDIKACMKEVRAIEQNLRNPVAHNITHVSEKMIEKFSAERGKKGYTAKQIFDLLTTFVRYSGVTVKISDFNTYGELNKEIEKRMGLANV